MGNPANITDSLPSISICSATAPYPASLHIPALEYGLEQLQQGLSNLFPGNEFSLRQVLTQIMQGDVLGAIRDILNAMLGDMGSQLAGLRNVISNSTS